MGLAVSLAAGAYATKSLPKLLDALLNCRIINIQDDDKPTTEAIPSNEDVDSIAEIQGVFNVLAQADMERAKLVGRKNSHALVQFWTGLVKSLWSKGKNYLKKKLYCKEQDMKALLQELTDEETDETNGKEDEEVRAQLQVLFNALQMVEANTMQEGNSDKEQAFAEGINDRIKTTKKDFAC
jgi:hypothetical protein